MEEREFTKYAFLIVAVVAIVGLLNSGFLEATGFAAKASKDPACLAAEKALAKAQTACKLAQNEYKTTPKKCDAAKKAYGLAQVSFAKTASEKTKSMMDQKKTAMDTACTAVETAKQKQDSACAFASQAADNKNVVCVTPASAQPTTPAPAPEAPVPTEQQAAAAQQAAQPEAAPAPPAYRWDPVACEDNDQVQDSAVAGNLTYVNASTSVMAIFNDGCVYGAGKMGLRQYECDLYGPDPIKVTIIGCEPQSCGNFTGIDRRANNGACPPVN